MNIIKKFFRKEKYIYCISCERKLHKDKFNINDAHAGICAECEKSLTLNKPGQSFEAVDPILYILSPLTYKDAAVKLLRDFKFRKDFKNGDIINIIMRDFLEYYPHLCNFDLVIPVPLSKERLNERGFNQSEIIAREISKSTGVALDTETLIRTRNTRRQSTLLKSERAYNVMGAFKAAKNLKDKNIILVDDIYTTGHTMKNCAEELKEKGAADIIGISAAITIID